MYSDETTGGGSGKDLGHYVSLFWRKKLIIAACAAGGAVLAAIAAMAMPKHFESSATILIEDPEIPPQMIGSTVTSFAEKRLEVIGQRIATTENLARIINEFDLYPEIREGKPILAAIEKLRSDFKLTKVSARMIDPESGRYRSALISFNLIYRNQSPQTAQKVTAELARLYVEYNVSERRGQAIEVAEFLSSESERLRRRVSELEDKLTAFKEMHPGFVAGQGQVMMDLIDRTEAQIREIDGKISTLDDRVIALQRELEVAGASATGEDALGRMSLPQLQAEYARITQIYGPDHPDVVRLKRRIETFEKTGAGKATGPAAAGAPVSPEAARLQAQITMARSERSRLRSQKEGLETKLKAYEAKTLATPQLEQRYLELRRDYENAKAQYDETKKKQLVADQARVLEKSNKSERFTLLEPPQVPRYPAGPSAKVIVAGGFGFFFMLGLALVFLLDLMDDRIRGSRQLEAVLGAPPLMLVPVLKTEEERQQTKGSRMAAALKDIWPANPAKKPPKAA